MKKIFPFLIGLVFLSGCLGIGGGGKEVSGYGIEITSFEVFGPPQIYSNDEIDLSLTVKNTGGKPARDVTGYLYGLSEDWELTDEKKQVADELKGPDEEMDIEGEQDNAIWTLVAPDLPKGLTNTYNPRVRVFYLYSTSASTQVPIITRDEYRKMVREGEKIPKQKVTTVTKGPLGVEITSANPVIMRGEGEDFRLMVKVTNLNDGSVFKYDTENIPKLGTDDYNKIELKIDAEGVTAKEKDCEALENSETVELRRGEYLTYNCELKIDEIVTLTFVPININMDYGYIAEDSVSLKVRGD